MQATVAYTRNAVRWLDSTPRYSWDLLSAAGCAPSSGGFFMALRGFTAKCAEMQTTLSHLGREGRNFAL